MLGKLLCWMGFHDWYTGITFSYCRRECCDAETKLIGDE